MSKRSSQNERICTQIRKTIWVSIPIHICEALEIKKGDILNCKMKGDKIIFDKKTIVDHDNKNSGLEEHESNNSVTGR